MEEQEITLSDYGRILLKRKWILILTFCVVFGSTYVYTKLETPIYRASIEVKVQRKGPVEPTLASILLPIHDLAAEIQLIRSLPIIQKAIEKVEPLPSNPVVREQVLSSAARSYQRSLKIKQIEDTNIINIQTVSDNPEKAAMFANALVDVFKGDGIESIKRKQAKVVLDYTESKIAEFKSRIQEGERELLKFEQNERALIVTPDVKKILDRMTVERTFEFESEMFKIQTELRTLQDVIDERINKGGETLFSDDVFSDNLIFTGLKRRLLELEFQRFLLLIDYTDDHPDVISQDNTIESVKDKMVFMVMDYKNVAANSSLIKDATFMVDMLFLKVKQEVLFRIVNKFYNESGSLSPDQLRYQELKRGVDKTIDLYNQFLDKKEEADLLVATELSDISVVSPAVVPRKPIKPNARVNYMVGVVIGFLLGVIMAFITEGLDTSVGTIEDVEKIIGYPILGIIPKLRDDYISVNIDDPGGGADELFKLFNPKSPSSESFMTLRTNLLHIMDTEEKKTILFTSPDQREGKTTTAMNVAISMAQAGRKTIFVEANLRNPAAYKFFGLPKGPGLTDVLIGRKTWQDSLKSSTDILMGKMGVDNLLEIPGIDNLSLITSGETVLNPSVILDSKTLGELFSDLRNNFDVVIVDCASVSTLR